MSYGNFFAITSKKEQIRFIQNYTHTQWTSHNPKRQISQWVLFLIFCSTQETSVKVKKSSYVFKCRILDLFNFEYIKEKYIFLVIFITNCNYFKTVLITL